MPLPHLLKAMEQGVLLRLPRLFLDLAGKGVAAAGLAEGVRSVVNYPRLFRMLPGACHLLRPEEGAWDIKTKFQIFCFHISIQNFKICSYNRKTINYF